MAEKPTASKKPTQAQQLAALTERVDALTSAVEKIAYSLRPIPSEELPVDPTTFPPEGLEFKTSSTAHPEPVTGGWYMRNLRNTDLSFRLSRQEKQGERRTSLKPRGQRGDMLKLTPEDLQDPQLETQVAYGLVEVIPEAEALNAIRKQAHNATQAPHGPLAMLRSETGKEYAPDAVRVDPEYNSQGTVVATLKPVVEGEYGEVDFKRGGGGFNREGGNAVQAGVGGNPAILSDGFAQQQLGGVDPNSVQRDALARAKGLEGPAAGLGNINVTVAETQKT
jgi:hypothetical protein